MKLKILDASYHRNGISGQGFYAILFNDADNGLMVASLFDESGYCAVYSVPKLAAKNVTFANGNSWRGDKFEIELRPLLQKWLKKHGSNRVGPFAILA